MMDHDLMSMAGGSSLPNVITTLGSFADSPITSASIISGGSTDLDVMVPDGASLITDEVSSETESLMHGGPPAVMMVDGSVSASLTDTHGLDTGSMISVCGQSIPLYSDGLTSTPLVANGGDNTSPITDNRTQLVSDGSGLVLLEMPKGSNMLLSVSGEIGGVNYGIPVSGTDLNGRQLLSTTIPASFLSGVQQDGTLDQHGVSVLLGVTGEGEETLDDPDIDQPVESLLDVSAEASKETEPKKRGGWPKGKRRKALPDISPPKAPLSGYVIFAIERRQEIKGTNPDLSFTEVTKILGQEWSNMEIEKKQKYLEAADKDKQRYADELKAFHQTEAYRNIVKKRKAKGSFQGVDGFGNGPLPIDEDLDEDLHCKVCDQYFSSLHNKKEHMYGRQHLQNITDELRKDVKVQSSQQSNNIATNSLDTGQFSHTNSRLDSDPDTGQDQQSPVDVQGFISGFIQDNLEREAEIRQLKSQLKLLQDQNTALYQSFGNLKAYENKLLDDIASEKSVTTTINSQIDGLKMVSTLFGVINFHDM